MIQVPAGLGTVLTVGSSVVEGFQAKSKYDKQLAEINRTGLSGKDKAIVTNIPGTTRDVIEEYINVEGIAIKLIDTAGIRETADVVEKIGVTRSKEEVEKADLVVFLADASTGLTKDDIDILESIKDKNIVVLLNKIDLTNDTDKVKKQIKEIADADILEVSILNDIGIEAFTKYIKNKFISGKINLNSEVLLTNVRHKNLLDKAKENITNAINAGNMGMPLDMITIDIKEAAYNLGEITGESVNDLILHEIFSKFCVGK